MRNAGIYEVLKNRVMIKRKDILNWPLQFHEHIEVMYMVRGTAKVTIDETEYTVSDGEFSIAFPFQSHGYEHEGKVDCYFLMFPLTLAPQFEEVFNTRRPQSPIFKNDSKDTEHMRKLLEMMIDEYPNVYYKYDTINNDVFRSYICLFMHSLLKSVELTDISSSNLHTLRNILDYCSKNFRNQIHLSDVADALYLSPKYISNIFSSKLRISFLDYINTVRIYETCDMLKGTDLTASQIAMDAGFDSLRTFHRRFKKVVGMTPAEYRKSSKYI